MGTRYVTDPETSYQLHAGERIELTYSLGGLHWNSTFGRWGVDYIFSELQKSHPELVVLSILPTPDGKQCVIVGQMLDVIQETDGTYVVLRPDEGRAEVDMVEVGVLGSIIKKVLLLMGGIVLTGGALVGLQFVSAKIIEQTAPYFKDVGNGLLLLIVLVALLWLTHSK